MYINVDEAWWSLVRASCIICPKVIRHARHANAIHYLVQAASSDYLLALIYCAHESYNFHVQWHAGCIYITEGLYGNMIDVESLGLVIICKCLQRQDVHSM